MAAFRTGVTKEHKPGGYPRMSCGPQYNKFVHILVAEAMLGRKLRADEHVHHKDGNVRNPSWTNLLVLDATVHNAVSIRQYWYLKQKFSREEAAWRAYFDVTGKTYDSLEVPSVQDASNPAGFEDTSFVPEMLIGSGMDEAAYGD